MKFMIPIKQTGATLLVVMLIMVVGVMSVIVTGLNQNSSIIKRDIKSTATLSKAKEALIGWAVTHPVNTGELPLPDTDNDGRGDCPVPVMGSDRLGRFPWLDYPAPCRNPRSGMGMNFKDQSEETLWYAVSANLIDDGITPPVIDAAMLLLTTGWISVFNETGTLLSDRVAAVIIAPGKALAGQNRANKIHPDGYLDSIQVGSTTYSNSDTDDQFIASSQQENFNDRLIYITVDELLNEWVNKVLTTRGGGW